MPELNIYSPKTTLLGEVYRPEPELRVSVEWNTLIRENRGGKENRTAKLSEPRYRLEGSDFVLTDATYTALTDFFNNRQGKQFPFEFKCPLDYYCTAIPEVYAEDISQQGVLVLIDTDPVNVYQICKKYTVNNVSSYKSITKPIAGTIALFDGTTPITGTVDVSTGRVTGISPVNGLVDCQFNLPFRFDIDDLQLNQIKRAVDDYRLNNDTNIYTAINFSLIEDNYTKVSPLLESDWTTDIIYTFDGHPLPDIAYSTRNTVRVESADNQREVREAQGEPRNVYKLGQNNFNWISLQKFFTLFQASKGRLLGFTFEGDLVRLNQDNFTAERIAESAWSFDGLEMIKVLNPSIDEVKNYAHCISIDAAPIPPDPPLIVEHIEVFSFEGTDNDVLYNFTFTTTNPAVPPTAQIYLMDGAWDSQGSIGTFNTPDVPFPPYNGYAYNRTGSSAILVESGAEVLIGTGTSVSGTVIEDEAGPGANQDASCSVRLRFVWS